MADLNVVIQSESINVSTNTPEFQIGIADTVFKVGLAEYGGYGPQGIQGPPGPPGASGADPTQIPVSLGGSTTDLQTAITQLSQLFFQQAGVPTTGVNEGDLWYDTTLNVLKVYQNATWVTVIAQPNLETATINGGYF